VLVVMADCRRKKKKKPSVPSCSKPTSKDCVCWFDLNRQDCACCVEDYCVQTRDTNACVHKDQYKNAWRIPYIVDTKKRKYAWCYGHEYWCGQTLYPKCYYPGKKRCSKRSRVYYADLIKQGLVNCHADAAFRAPAGERQERCVCNDGFIGNGLQCMKPGDDDFVEVVEKIDPSQFVKISFEIESNSTFETVSAMEALTSNCIASKCNLDETRS